MTLSELKDYFWIECDGYVKYHWEKFGATKIPNNYLPYILKDKLLYVEFIDSEYYDYCRTVETDSELKLRKCIFGFDKREIIDKFIEEQNTYVDNLIEKIKNRFSVNESVEDDFSMIPVYTEFLRNYVEEMLENWTYTYTEYELEKIKEYTEILKNYYDKYQNTIEGHQRQMIEMVTDNMDELLNNWYTVLKAYSFGDYLECASDDFSSNTSDS